MGEQRTYEPTDVYDEIFSDEMGTSWIVKSEERTPTRERAKQFVSDLEGEPYTDYRCRTRNARVEWRDYEGWWLTVDPDGPYEVWEVYLP